MTAIVDAPPDQLSPVRFHQVGKAFGTGRTTVVALDGVDLEVRSGEFVCLLGASGCGKSTLLNLVAGLDRPTAGTIELNSSRPAVVFQEAALMPWLTAAGNVELPLRMAGVPKAQRRAKAAELLELVRLAGLGEKRPHELSGGMRQRVALARALASTTDSADAGKPSLLLMDEPFSALDALTRTELSEELQRIKMELSTTIVFVTHSIEEAVVLADRVVVLTPRPGRMREVVEIGIPRPRSLGQNAHLTEVAEISGRLHELLAEKEVQDVRP